MVDDSEAILMESKSALMAAGFNVVATSQTVGIARHLKECDLVVLDFHMPGLDGGTVLQSLKAAVRDSNEPPLFYMYSSDDSAATRAKALGFDGVFTQKGVAAALVRQVDSVFRFKRLRALSQSYPPPKD
jgi:CheY-like chemotaxis protein